MAQIVMINRENLYHHPDNPRKNIGDVSELAASIKEKGILQNLTVVPIPDEEGNYYIVIGNRRYEAGKAAGIHDYPCVIADMDYATQLETMLIENMQRSDLTVLEEAQGFQQLMFEGYSVEQISKKTGFSQSTVRRRTQLADYNEDVVQQAFDRGGTLEDFAKLNQIEDESMRNELATKIGTRNFDWEIKHCKQCQKVKSGVEAIKNEYSKNPNVIFCNTYADITMITREKEMSYRYASDIFDNMKTSSYDLAEIDAKEIIKNISDNDITSKYTLLIMLPSNDYELYARLYVLTEKPKEIRAKAPSGNSNSTYEEKPPENYDVIKNNEQLETLHDNCRSRRYDFARKKYRSKLTKKEQSVILIVAAKFLCHDSDSPNNYNEMEFFELTQSEHTGTDIDDGEFYLTSDNSEYEVNSDNAINLIFAQIYSKLDDAEYTSRADEDWREKKFAKPIKPDDDDYSQGYWKLLLELLFGLGYETSDEEQQYYDGTHPLFVSEKEGE
jgi:ParB family chromosome partitioning protein